MSEANGLDSLVGRGFDLLVSDPPWPVKKIVRKVRPNQVATLDYPTMTLDEIKAMPVAGCAADNAVFFLWTTHAFLRAAFDVMDAYGFRYQRTLTWDKANGMCLFGFHHRTEFALFGYKGKIEMYPHRKAIPTVFGGKSERHSAKPDEFYRMVEPLGANRLDIFARRQREGWTVWGNEVVGNVPLERSERSGDTIRGVVRCPDCVTSTLSTDRHQCEKRDWPSDEWPTPNVPVTRSGVSPEPRQVDGSASVVRCAFCGRDRNREDACICEPTDD